MDADTQRLIEAAREAQSKAYAPYSNYQVGAALLTRDGRIFSGCNVENAVYSAGVCAERVAIAKAVSEGCREFVKIVVVTRNGGSPCGICRQVMFEFAPDMQVIIADLEKILQTTTVRDLLPAGFGPQNLS